METDWLYGLLGGLVIGSAAAAYLLLNGKVMGASGVLGRLVDGTGLSDAGERFLFIAGLIALPGLIGIWRGSETGLTSNVALVVVAGLAVGIGTRLANGCTSGHGVCGMSRLSPRGIAASAAYVGAGVLTVTIMGAFV